MDEMNKKLTALDILKRQVVAIPHANQLEYHLQLMVCELAERLEALEHRSDMMYGVAILDSHSHASEARTNDADRPAGCQSAVTLSNVNAIQVNVDDMEDITKGIRILQAILDRAKKADQ